MRTDENPEKEKKKMNNLFKNGTTFHIIEHFTATREIYDYVDEEQFDDHDTHGNKFFIDRKKKPMRAKKGKSIKKQRLMKCPRR